MANRLLFTMHAGDVSAVESNRTMEWQIAPLESQVRVNAVAHISSSLLEGICFPALRSTQNADGGWGFGAGLPSAVEATSWSLLAGTNLRAQETWREPIAAGCKFLKKTQLADGAWPCVAGQREGGWVTSLACRALLESEGVSGTVHEALDWLCCSWPGEGGTWWRVRNRLTSQAGVVKQDHRLRGWSWTKGTSSWVEPTAYALLALRGASGSFPSSHLVGRRQELGEAMLCNRMCPGGGWNAGNPWIYGVQGAPLVAPTAFALLALGRASDTSLVRKCTEGSLAWLEREYEFIQSPGSLALAHLCLTAYGGNQRHLEERLLDNYRKNEFLHNTTVFAWAALALQPIPAWIRPTRRARN